MELARQIQLSLLPAAPPELSGVVLAGCCVPATQVGGDYYDYYLREDGQVDLVIADVSGHSIGAALMMVEFRSLLRSRVHSFSSTGDMLVFLNDLLYDDLNQSGLFITLFFIKYDQLTRTLAYSSAGHVLPLLVRIDGEQCRELDAEGMILGVKKGVEFEEKQIRMQAGDVLFLHTDGIIESKNSSGEQFGIVRLCAIVQARRSEAPQAIIDAVLREVSIFRGAAPQEDDVTMIVMKIV
jgi:sigma-B regulation protein RsbU (phosphoserine phosphatase)